MFSSKCYKVEHPAAKMMVLASQQQEQECGDGTNFTLIFSGALLEHAEDLIRMVWKQIFCIWGSHLFCSCHFYSGILCHLANGVVI